MRSFHRTNEYSNVHLVLFIFFFLMATIPVEIVSSDEYEALETSIQLAEALLKSRASSNWIREKKSEERDYAEAANTTFDVSVQNSAHQFDKIRTRCTSKLVENDMDIEETPPRAVLDPSPLEMWGRSAVFVTTLCTQEWCELQLDFSLRSQ
jgi:hypothetical protein